MKQTNLFDAPVESGADEISRAKSNPNERAPFYDKADSLLQATMVQISIESAREYVRTDKHTVYELADSGDYSVVTDEHQIKDDTFYGYEIF